MVDGATQRIDLEAEVQRLPGGKRLAVLPTPQAEDVPGSIIGRRGAPDLAGGLKVAAEGGHTGGRENRGENAVTRPWPRMKNTV